MNKHIAVSGAATGIGAAVTQRLLADGTRVTGLGLDKAAGWEQQDKARGEGRDYTFHELDVTDEMAVSNRFAELEPITGLVNCAGIYPPDQRLEDVSLTNFTKVLTINLVGTFLICRAALPMLRRAGGGSIVNVSSVHAIAGAPGQGAYAASKAAVAALTRQIAVDYACDGVRANSIVVGAVDTRITRAALAQRGPAEELGLSFNPTTLGRIAAPREIAAVVAFLLGSDSSFLTASALLADGGLTSRIL